MVGRLCDILPDAKDLLRLQPEELAGIILEMISAPRGPTDAGISLGGFIDQALASSNPMTCDNDRHFAGLILESNAQ